jgi:hypothetical protein
MKKPSLPIGFGVGRAIAELAIIVAGVLIALGAQSWWESRSTAEDRRAALDALRSDLALAAAELRDDLARIDTTEVSIRWLLDADTDFDAAPDSIFTTRLRYALWEISGSDIAIPSYEDLKGSGRLGLLPPDVRDAFAVLESRGQGLDGMDDDNFQYQIRNLDPWLLDNAPLRGILEYDDGGSGPRERMPTEVLRSRRVENMLLAKLELVENLRSAIGRMQDQIERVLALIDG